MTKEVNRETYFHFRFINEDAEVVNKKTGTKETTRIVHAKGGVTICARPIEGDKIALGIACCSIHDQFIKSLANKKSKGRSFSKNDQIVVRGSSIEDIYDKVEEIANHEASHHNWGKYIPEGYEFKIYRKKRK